jgi:hypothetical protein
MRRQKGSHGFSKLDIPCCARSSYNVQDTPSFMTAMGMVGHVENEGSGPKLGQRHQYWKPSTRQRFLILLAAFQSHFDAHLRSGML